MRYISLHIRPPRRIGIALCAIAALAAFFAAVFISAPADRPTKRTAATGQYTASQTDAEPLGDVGGEYEIVGDGYDGELVVPTYIRLDRLSIDEPPSMPLEKARVSSVFGYRQNPVSGKYSFHSGYDLAAPAGSDIHAMYAGRVISATYDEGGYGKYIIIEHPFGVQTLYAHCSRLLCECGDTVEKGEKIALVGSTGNSTGPHLHVEFRFGGQRYDPEWILGGLYG